MFRYFGYGSNLRPASLRAKGVSPVAFEPAVLDGWRLVFNLAHPFRFEGKAASIVPDPGGAVHGALSTCEDADLAALDRHEGYGRFYTRRAVTVRTYAGEALTAWVYVGLPHRTGTEGRPSQRYHGVIVEGGRAVGLHADYLAWLNDLTVEPLPAYSPFVPPAAPAAVLTWEDVRARPVHTALLGHVFDMAPASEAHVTLRALLAGIDATAFFLRRLEASAGAGAAPGALSALQRRYLNAYLHAFAEHYAYAGCLASDEPGAPHAW